MLWLGERAGPLHAVALGLALAGAITVLAAGVMSLGIEVLQGWLPSRVPSNLDLLCNLIGAAGGVAVAIALFPSRKVVAFGKRSRSLPNRQLRKLARLGTVISQLPRAS